MPSKPAVWRWALSDAAVLVCLLLAACGSSNKHGLYLSGAGGSVPLDGTWSYCALAASGSYFRNTIAIIGSRFDNTGWQSLAQPDCSDATGGTNVTASGSLFVNGSKSVYFSSDGGLTADDAAPAGLTQPVDAARVRVRVTDSSDSELAGTNVLNLWYPVATDTPNVIYEGTGPVEADGYAPYLSATSTFERQ
jgi:hypothetical protein